MDTQPPEKPETRKRYTGIRIDRATCDALVKATGAKSRSKAYEIVIKDYLSKHPLTPSIVNDEDEK